jgi:hypothetical protein
MNQQTDRNRPFVSPGEALARQVVLPMGKSVELSVRSLKARFFRSLITVMSLVLAVAFLAFTLTGHDVAGGLAASNDPHIRAELVKAGYEPAPAPAPAPAPGPGQGGQAAAAGARDRWIVILSLLVCTVGIVNAQLMAVTERFREIGTMKCLGALDSFVLRLFLLEAGMQGLAGSLAGALAGSLTGVLTGVLRFGPQAVHLLAFQDLAASLGLSVLAGVCLSLVGVAYPALVAARMPPVAAMRAEE